MQFRRHQSSSRQRGLPSDSHHNNNGKSEEQAPIGHFTCPSPCRFVVRHLLGLVLLFQLVGFYEYSLYRLGLRFVNGAINARQAGQFLWREISDLNPFGLGGCFSLSKDV